MEDEIDLLQLGQRETIDLYDLKIGQTQISSWLDYPERYKFTGVEILFDFDLLKVDR